MSMDGIRVRYAALIAALGLSLIFGGCSDTTPAPSATQNTAAPTATVDAGIAPTDTAPTTTATEAPKHPAALYVIKNGKPFVLVNLASEAGKLRGMPAAQQEAHVIRQTALLLVETALDREEYEGMDRFVARVIVLTELDEYGRANWGKAVELGSLEFDRATLAATTVEGVKQLDEPAVTALAADRKFQLTNLAAVTKTLR